MAAQPRKALVLYNPTAGTVVDMDVYLGTVVHTLCRSNEYTAVVVPTFAGMNHKDAIDVVASGKFDLIVAAGGDGTIRLALGAVSVAAPETPVAIIPLGTGNQLARNLNIYEDNLLVDPLTKAIDVMMSGRPRRIDLGTMNGEYFCVAAGVGPLSDAVSSPTREDKKNLKMLAYISSVAQTFALPPIIFRIATGNDVFEVTASGVFVTNVSDLGVGVLSESADLDDGLLDLCIMNPTDFGEYIHLGFRFLGTPGGGGEAPYYIRKVSSVDIEVVPVKSKLSGLQAVAHRVRTALLGRAAHGSRVVKEAVASIDGDACGTTPMHIEVLPNAVAVVTLP